MMGSPDAHGRGIIPRAVNQILDECARLSRDHGWHFRLSASFVEVYNDSIRDLLVELADDTDKPKSPVKLEDIGGKFFVKGETRIQITSCADAAKCLATASRERSVHDNGVNELSSRSHGIFTLHVERTENGETRHGKLVLVDLAGSERPKRVTAERLQETKHINSSLSALKRVFLQMQEKRRSHVSRLSMDVCSCLSRSRIATRS
jgi:kinesin family protein C1